MYTLSSSSSDPSTTGCISSSCSVVVLYSVGDPVVLFAGVYFLRYLADFAVVNQLDCAAAMTVKLREHLLILGYCSHYSQPSLLWSDENVFTGKANNMCFDWSRSCGDFFRHELVKFILTILKRNISPVEL